MNASVTLFARRAITAVFFITLAAVTAFAQGNGFTYQSRLTEGTNNLPANGRYDFQFSLFPDSTSVTPIASTNTNTLTDVQVTNGVFAVVLDFGAAAFSGEKRWLQISVRLAGNGAFTPLSPRREITPTPYAIRSQIATAADRLSPSCAGCVTDGQIAAVAGSKVTGTIPAASVPTGSSNYIQNTQGTTTQQANSSFNISGNGTAGGILLGNVVQATTEYRLGIGAVGETRILHTTGINNMFVGLGAGTANTNGRDNSFFGRSAGNKNDTGSQNSFFGQGAGEDNKTGNDNAFFGYGAGTDNISGSRNSYFGYLTGGFNTEGSRNAFFGSLAGFSCVPHEELLASNDQVFSAPVI